MRITRYQDIREGDVIFTSYGPQTVASVNQYVSWAEIRVVRDDMTEWSMQLHESSMGRFTIERDDYRWTCPSCGHNRRVMQGFPLTAKMTPFTDNYGARIVCKSCNSSYLVPKGERDPNLVPVVHDVQPVWSFTRGTSKGAYNVKDNVTGESWTVVKGDDGMWTSFRRSLVTRPARTRTEACWLMAAFLAPPAAPCDPSQAHPTYQG